MSIVSIAKCDDYTLEKVYHAIHRSLSLLNGTEMLVRPGKKVLLKLNLLSSSQTPERAVNTHPAVVRALVDIFQKDFGCEVYIGDSSGSVKNSSTFNAFRVTRINEIAENTGAKIVNFDKDKYIDVYNKDYEILDKFRIARTLREVDFIVSVPKLKTHGLTQYTGAIKNMLGSIPGNGKKNVHLIAPKPTVFAKALVDIYQMAPPHLIIMDAIVGMEGNGPNAGNPKKVGLIISSRDSVALDTVASNIIGFEPMAVPTIRFAHQRGLGIGELRNITVAGESIQNVAVHDFKKPSSGAQDFAGKYLPNFLLAMMFDNTCSTFSTVNHSNCTRCYECVRNCPAGAMSKDTGKVEVDKKKCIGCFCCDEVCDFHAIEMKRSLVGRALLGMAKALGVEKVE
ncbi:iron-sulfur cluster-binding protein [Candidatus Kuenenia stuttgartiensis]|jgi:uncharacterized protein (DUF362 family)/Pyruvate/2-oxoacid:ferredoxin oxidoreductase delta subunit|uniref:Iron-sulfur cluster-binding protein n=1 Tax=Kuenenia stuttgartiensis TaxID=174633 RepID=Q1Q0G5_KUEST|nr:MULTISPECIES: DUF362 domain-containing protein [Kuenenia]MBW7941680.1 DUF362 domain-containing protein [Candidatus Kuenenia stuttgartiensis]MBZ0191418.1 DUF362 domain-containing protein [Candidatus Kuenenia stuttgartiensis]MCF6153361.1 DUF362 domain-containing protein [Candidatus Kuenenia stuttgartiensis]MCL4727977.1 DUF362 domain-containing protein [Candidatus Kuenenia stuttgartiensis]MCZ7624393.1 DUF362 domain-containing protein [Candidatus Kuenenia sp.]